MEINQENKIVLYGIYDTQDNCWLGDEFGPKRFDDFMVARIAAQVYEDQTLGTDLGGRYKAKPIPTEEFQKKDEIATKRTTLKSLQRIEGRAENLGEPIIIDMSNLNKDPL